MENENVERRCEITTIDVKEVQKIIRQFEEKEGVRGVIICDSSNLHLFIDLLESWKLFLSSINAALYIGKDEKISTNIIKILYIKFFIIRFSPPKSF